VQDTRFSQQSCWWFRFSGMWHYVVGSVVPGILWKCQEPLTESSTSQHLVLLQWVI